MFVFKALMENIRSNDKNNWNLSTDQFFNLASSLKNFFAQSGIMHRINHKVKFNDELSMIYLFLKKLNIDYNALKVWFYFYKFKMIH